MELEDRVWLACAIDTDGWLAIKRQKQTSKGKSYTYYLTFIGFHNNNREIVEKFARLIGGKVYPSRGEHKVSWTTQTTNRGKVTEILEEILEYLIVKKDRAEYLIAYNQFRSDNPGDHTDKSTRVDQDKAWYEEYRQLFSPNKNGVQTGPLS